MEFVYVVERRRLFDLHFPHGLVLHAEQPDEVARYLQRIREHGFFVERRKAEEDSSLKQIIPYVVVRRGDEVLLLERKSTQGEARLHGKRSIGVGGHINPIDEDEGDVLVAGMQREIDEELAVEAALDLRVAGFLNDDSTPVGSVHFGLVAVAHAGNGALGIRETDKMDGRLVQREQLAQLHTEDPDRFETWSSMIVQRLGAVLDADCRLESALSAKGAGGS